MGISTIMTTKKSSGRITKQKRRRVPIRWLLYLISVTAFLSLSVTVRLAYNISPSLSRKLSSIEEPHNSKDEKSEEASKTIWGGSILHRALSPLLTTAPPSFKAPHAIEESPAAPFDRDVIVVTGGLHNIGRHLLETLQQGYSSMSGPITALVLDSATVPTGPDGTPIFSKTLTGNSPDVNVEVIVKQVDITEYDAVFDALTAYATRIRGVVHLAAVSSVQGCHSDDQRCKDVNVGGTENIMNALYSLYGKGTGAVDVSSTAGRATRPWLVFASSREVYGALARDEVAEETSTLRPLSVYGETKLDAEKAIQLWTRKTGFNAVVVRFTNVYGSCHDHGTRLVPNMVSKLVSDDQFFMFGSSDKTISLLHVQDAVQSLLLGVAYASTLDNGAGYYDVFNIGGGATHDVLDIKDVYRIAQTSVGAVVPTCKFCNSPPSVIKDTSGRAPEPEHFRSSIIKASRVLGYNPSRTFDETTLGSYIETCEVVEPALARHTVPKHLRGVVSKQQ